jgi:hypothetical protein
MFIAVCISRALAQGGHVHSVPEKNAFLNSYVNSNINWTVPEQSITKLGKIVVEISTDKAGKITQVMPTSSSLNNISPLKNIPNSEAIISKKFIVDQVLNSLTALKTLDSQKFEFDKTKESTKAYEIELNSQFKK